MKRAFPSVETLSKDVCDYGYGYDLICVCDLVIVDSIWFVGLLSCVDVEISFWAGVAKLFSCGHLVIVASTILCVVVIVRSLFNPRWKVLDLKTGNTQI